MTGSLRTRPLGASGLALTEVGYGGAAVGNLYVPYDDASARRSITAAIDAGIRYFDTAPSYGFGLSERRIGDAVRGRSDIVLSTKIGRLLRPDGSVTDDRERQGFRSSMPFTPVFDYTRDGIMRSFEASLQRLGLARVSMLYVHDIGTLTHGKDDAVHFDALTRGGGLSALEDLRAAGAIDGFGVGVNEVAACERVMDIVVLDAILLAGRYTLLDQSALTALLPTCARTGTAVVIGGPYNSGILANGVSGPGTHRFDYGDAPAEIVARVPAIEMACVRHGVPLAAAALQFPLAPPAVASVIPGLASPEQVAETLRLYHWPIPSSLWDELREAGLIAADAPVPEGR